MSGERSLFRAEPTATFKWEFDLLQGDERLARLVLEALLPRATAEFDGQVVRMARDGALWGLFDGTFLSDRPKERLSAIKPSAFQQRFELIVDGRWLLLEAPSAFDRKLVLRDNGVEIGTVRSVSAFSRTAIFDLPAELDLHAQVFVTWLALYLWKRKQEGG